DADDDENPADPLDSDWDPGLDDLDETKDEDDVAAIRSARTVGTMYEPYRRVLLRQLREFAAVMPPPDFSDRKQWAELPPGEYHLVNYYEKTCTCLGFTQSGARCVHLYSVECFLFGGSLRKLGRDAVLRPGSPFVSR
ncbi:MAG: SWIM zinc finger family protein, partial [Acidobacteriota bacterium]|nr:SWIM zinc finger family protein [Acidobacteriota bacterium]